MKYTDYQLSEEYRDRHGFNQGDIYFLKEALNTFAQEQEKIIKEMEKEGKQSVVAPAFFRQLAEGLVLKAESFLVKRDTFDDEE